MNLYLSTLAAWVGFVVAVAVLVYVCAKLCAFVQHEWKLRQVWREKGRA